MVFRLSLIILLGCISLNGLAQQHTTPGQEPDGFPEHPLRYHPDGQDFVIVNGDKRFNRALYGTHTGFRVEAGDLPEFAFYMPGKGGNLKLGVIDRDSSRWLTDFAHIESRYRPGSMLYTLKDPVLGEGTIFLHLLALDTAEGLVLQIKSEHIPDSTDLVWTFGGASGKKFHRDGDIGADPESVFYLEPEHCAGNMIDLSKGIFTLGFQVKQEPYQLSGAFPERSRQKIADAKSLETPADLWNSGESEFPVVAGRMPISEDSTDYLLIKRNHGQGTLLNEDLSKVFLQAQQHQKQLAGRVLIKTPDPYLNTLGGALSVAADAIWESPTYLHGAVAWRTRLNGWRGAYAADALGWHDRAKKHFQAYSASQITDSIFARPFPDPAKNLARQKEVIGAGIFDNGYISRRPEGEMSCGHYDMNLVFIDQLLRHFQWTADTALLKASWPVIERHLAWEKRHFDGNDDGLYDAYCCIWASDALQYSGGGVTHSSAYNYYANRQAAKLASWVGKNPEPYLTESKKIRQAIQSQLWLSSSGHYAEYKDAAGAQATHQSPGLWTIYHAIDSEVPDAFQAYQTLQYVKHSIPHIPINNNQLEEDLSLIATTNWMPYTWSINNVALAEGIHTALACWQAGQQQQAFHLFKSFLVESMYMGSSPGNFQQLSFYDRFRGELYRDFADPVGITARTVVEGLFGIHPDLLSGKLDIRPGYPLAWDSAGIHLPDLDYYFEKHGDTAHYQIQTRFGKLLSLRLQLPATHTRVQSVKVNGKPTDWEVASESVGQPAIFIQTEAGDDFDIEVVWASQPPEKLNYDSVFVSDEEISVRSHIASILKVYDPQKVLADFHPKEHELQGRVSKLEGPHTFFVYLQQEDISWWQPVNIMIHPAITISKPRHAQTIILTNHLGRSVDGTLIIGRYSQPVRFSAHEQKSVSIPQDKLVPGTFTAQVALENGQRFQQKITDWGIPSPDTWPTKSFEMVSLTAFFNEQVSHIFEQDYLVPRTEFPTLQLPEQGIGNWCYPLINPPIDDQGLRRVAADGGFVMIRDLKVPLKTPSEAKEKNIIFTSQWKQFPDSMAIPLQGKASHAYLLMTGTTNPMQSRFDNGAVTIRYKDGSEEKLILRNPDNWWPIEQDYYFDQYAFDAEHTQPYRLHLKTGEATRHHTEYESIKGFTDRSIAGGAATVLDLPLDPEKELDSLTVSAKANDVIIGLMSVTLLKND